MKYVYINNAIIMIIMYAYIGKAIRMKFACINKAMAIVMSNK